MPGPQPTSCIFRASLGAPPSCPEDSLTEAEGAGGTEGTPPSPPTPHLAGGETVVQSNQHQRSHPGEAAMVAE